MIEIDKHTKVININNENFPSGLLNLKDCPTRLYAIGNESLLKTISIAIVGTRACSDYGKKLAYDFSKELSKYNITIISGMADGIDESAHCGTYEYGNTIAVVAGGFKEILKGSKQKIAEKILNNNGLIISEYDPDYTVAKGMFFRRNRLIAAISSATVIIEAPIESGAMNTASHALKLQRPLYAIPWSLNYFKGKGCISLFMHGAKPLINASQILNDLKLVSSQIELDFESIKQSEKNIPSEFIKYYEFIKQNSPCLLESLLENFNEEFVGNIISTLTLMELNNLIKSSEKGYFIA